MPIDLVSVVDPETGKDLAAVDPATGEVLDTVHTDPYGEPEVIQAEEPSEENIKVTRLSDVSLPPESDPEETEESEAEKFDFEKHKPTKPSNLKPKRIVPDTQAAMNRVARELPAGYNLAGSIDSADGTGDIGLIEGPGGYGKIMITIYYSVMEGNSLYYRGRP